MDGCSRRARLNTAVPRARSKPIACASISTEVPDFSPFSHCRTRKTPWTTIGSPRCTDANTCWPKLRQQFTVKKDVSPSSQIPFRFRRGVLARRRLATKAPPEVVRETRSAQTLPETVMRLSFMIAPFVGSGPTLPTTSDASAKSRPKVWMDCALAPTVDA